MLDFLGQLGDEILMQVFQLVQMALISKEHICFIKDEATKLAEIELAGIAALL